MHIESKDQAFSLTELLVVIAILGVLVGVALPSYYKYVAKTKVAIAYQDAKSAKTKLSSIYAKSGGQINKVRSANYPKNGNDVTDYDFLKPSSDDVTSIVIKGGRIIVTLDPSAVKAETPPVITHSMDSSGNWSCIASESLQEYLSECQ